MKPPHDPPLTREQLNGLEACVINAEEYAKMIAVWCPAHERAKIKRQLAHAKKALKVLRP